MEEDPRREGLPQHVRNVLFGEDGQNGHHGRILKLEQWVKAERERRKERRDLWRAIIAGVVVVLFTVWTSWFCTQFSVTPRERVEEAR